jgi:glycosyltransferase involved in cell wall biosynthesis
LGQRHLLVLTRYGDLGASSRVRFTAYADALRDVGIETNFVPLLDDDYISLRYAGRPAWGTVLRGYLKRLRVMLSARADFAAVWLEKELWPWAPACFELWLLSRRPFVLDLDDAIFHNYDQKRSRLLRWVYGSKIDRLMRAACVVVAGNDYLAARARSAGATDVRVIPTAIVLERYDAAPAAHANNQTLVIGWIGSPATVHYLSLVAPALRALARRYPITLHVIGGGDFRIEGVEVKVVPWSEATEGDCIRRCDVGIMPLYDSPWERGKCGYKLIQYMACGLPVVASPVGVNVSIVSNGDNGCLAGDEQAWTLALSRLAADSVLRHQQGQRGRLRIEKFYCTRVTTPALVAALRKVLAAANDAHLASPTSDGDFED